MSLKTFHILFIALSIILCIGFGVWQFGIENDGGTAGQSASAAVSFLLGIALVAYLVRAIRKLREVR